MKKSHVQRHRSIGAALECGDADGSLGARSEFIPYLHERVKVIDGKMPMDMLKAISN